ncbi:MAG TPA: hypothetical protein VJ256_02235 [Dehalococcoidia bacterium]|nr:hypothetical protein [Dehalococcoidia bacterium]
MAAGRQPLSKLAVASSEAEARIWLEILRQGGIVAIMRNVDALSIAYMASPALPCSYELWTLASDLPRARRLLGLREALPRRHAHRPSPRRVAFGDSGGARAESEREPPAMPRRIRGAEGPEED